MAASGGGVVPCPPKRPTIIRPSNNTELSSQPGVPARPAPPVSGTRPQPLPPNRPPEPSSRPQPLPPQRPPNVSKPPASLTPVTKPPDRSNSTSVRKRPEITVVSARPMSEVGFRDSKVDQVVNKSEISDSAVISKDNDVNVNDHSPPTINQAPPPNPRPGLRGAPPPVPRSTVPKPTISANVEVNNEEMEDEADAGSYVTIQDVKSTPLRGPPPPVPRPTVIKPSASSGPSRAPPPVPGRPKDQLLGLSTQNLGEQNSEQSVKTSPPRPLGVPPPLPRSPSSRQKPSVPSSFSSNESNEIQTNNNQNASSNAEVTNTDTESDFYAVIEKPKRPTIIRPKKREAESSDGNVTQTPQLPPRLYDKVEDNDANVDAKNNDLLSFDSPESHIEVPEFLRKKLKSTTQDRANESDITGLAAGSRPDMLSKPRPVSHGAPPPPTKPKPTVLPKPSVAAKPSPPAKPVASENQNTTFKISSDINTDKVTKESDQINTDIGSKTDYVQKPLVKRPTIIRPSKAVKSGSVENINQSVDSVENHQSSDDSAISSNTRRQPPLPNKRPVSMYDIHKAVENEEQQIFAISVNDNIAKSVENVNEDGLRPKPSPRPASRNRPASMMVPPVSRPPPPTINSKVLPVNSESSSQPPRPQIRSSSKPLQHDSAIDKPQRPHVPIGVAVLPNMGDFGPPKPMRRPPPPKSSPKQQSSSDDEEFITAQEKPDRPAAGPPPRPSMSAKRESPGSVRRNSSEDDAKKPARPGAPPPPRKSSIIDSPEKDESTDVRRPPKPEGRPQRPMSMPVKQAHPPKPHPPKPQPPRQTRGPRSAKKDVPPLPGRPGPGHPLYYHMMQVPHGIAVHDFSGEQRDDISFKTGEVIVLVRGIDAEWMVGKIGDKEGMFPRSFVKVKMPLPGEKLEDDVSSEDSSELFFDASSEKPDNIGHGPRCRARFDFDGEGADDLIFEEGDVIRLVKRVGLEWRKGEINGCTGLFPLSFVEVIEDLPESKEEDCSNVVKALFDFEGEEGDLMFQAGEIIKVTHVVNEEWLYGETGDRKGQFPIQFIDHVPQGLPPLHDSVDNSVVTKHDDKLSASQAMWDDDTFNVKQKHVETTEYSPSTDTPYCVAVYDYPGQTMEDLSFNEGDRIEIVERIGADWLKGKLHGHVGMFPAAFVEVKVDVTATATTTDVTVPSTQEDKEIFGVALYDFIGEAENELTFHTGDNLVVQGPVEGAEDWSWGVINGHRGMFPAAFVEISS